MIFAVAGLLDILVTTFIKQAYEILISEAQKTAERDYIQNLEIFSIPHLYEDVEKEECRLAGYSFETLISKADDEVTASKATIENKFSEFFDSEDEY